MNTAVGLTREAWLQAEINNVSIFLGVFWLKVANLILDDITEKVFISSCSVENCKLNQRYLRVIMVVITLSPSFWFWGPVESRVRKMWRKLHCNWGQTSAAAAAAAAKSPQSYLTLCDPIDGSPAGSSVCGILQARTMEWVAISFSKTLAKGVFWHLALFESLLIWMEPRVMKRQLRFSG